MPAVGVHGGADVSPTFLCACGFLRVMPLALPPLLPAATPQAGLHPSQSRGAQGSLLKTPGGAWFSAFSQEARCDCMCARATHR